MSILHHRHVGASTVAGGSVRCYIPEGGTVKDRIAGVTKYGGRRNCVSTKGATVGGRRGSPPRQPPAVRRMKAALEDLNDLTSATMW